MPDLSVSLDRMRADRQAALDAIFGSARRNKIAALLLIGSLGRGGGDAWSDLDLIAVPGGGGGGLDLAAVFGEQVVAYVEAPRNAPVGGSYHGVCLEITDGVLWIDLYVWPQEIAAVPADATPIYDELGLPSSSLDFIPLITAHADPDAPAHPDGGAVTLLRIGVAAKYLARRDNGKLAGTASGLPGVRLDEVPQALRQMASAVTEPGLTRAVSATLRLVDLAATASAAAGGPGPQDRRTG